MLLAGRLEELIRRLPNVDLIAVVDAEEDAIRRIRETHPDVLILDLHLRQGSGFGVLRALTKDASPPKVIVLTNYGVPEYRRQAEALGASAFLDKSRDYGRLPSMLLEYAQDQHDPRPS